MFWQKYHRAEVVNLITIFPMWHYNNLKNKHPKAIEKGVKSFRFTSSEKDDELYSTMSSKVQEMNIEVYSPTDTNIRLT